MRLLDIVGPLEYNRPMMMMSVTDILQTATRSCDFYNFDGSPDEWMKMLQYKANDSGFGRLIDSILENGWEPGSAVGFENGYIGEGHHRITAAILLGLDEIPVRGGWGSSPGTICAHDEPGGIYNEFHLFDIPETEYVCCSDCG